MLHEVMGDTPRSTAAHYDNEPAQWKLDCHRRFLTTPDGTQIPLTRRELQLLGLLSSSRGRPVSRDTIARNLMRREWLPGDRSMDVLVRRLRDKLEHYTSTRDLIRTERNLGYSLSQACLPR